MTELRVAEPQALLHSDHVLGTCAAFPEHPQEPELLRAEKEQVERNAQNIAITQYGAFIETASCLGSVDRELRSVCDNLAAMLQVS